MEAAGWVGVCVLRKGVKRVLSGVHGAYSGRGTAKLMRESRPIMGLLRGVVLWYRGSSDYEGGAGA